MHYVTQYTTVIIRPQYDCQMTREYQHWATENTPSAHEREMLTADWLVFVSFHFALAKSSRLDWTTPANVAIF